jgi:hypothetical protein
MDNEGRKWSDFLPTATQQSKNAVGAIVAACGVRGVNR